MKVLTSLNSKYNFCEYSSPRLESGFARWKGLCAAFHRPTIPELMLRSDKTAAKTKLGDRSLRPSCRQHALRKDSAFIMINLFAEYLAAVAVTLSTSAALKVFYVTLSSVGDKQREKEKARKCYNRVLAYIIGKTLSTNLAFLSASPWRCTHVATHLCVGESSSGSVGPHFALFSTLQTDAAGLGGEKEIKPDPGQTLENSRFLSWPERR
uniref:Dimer_Tnp_hAT domain-containing protein n=1 Tax=Ascaris lumbricoides TaxID=6252 RepID=A0A0M3I3C9_ASCLU